MQNRRKFLGSLATAAVGVAASTRIVEALGIKPALRHTKLDRIGIQLYTLRRQASADLAGTLAQLSKIGYREIEFAGYYGHSASDVRALLTQYGLTAPSAHIAIEQILSSPDKTFADAKTVGHEWITAPSLPNGNHQTADDWKHVADQFNAAATLVNAAGFRFAFHNHNDIVKRTGNVLPIDILMKATNPSLVSYEMDIYWAVNGGADPLALLATYPGRFKMFHVKDGMQPPGDIQTDVGAGTIDFKTIFARATGIEHYFVESDSARDPIAFAAASHRYLANLEF